MEQKVAGVAAARMRHNRYLGCRLNSFGAFR